MGATHGVSLIFSGGVMQLSFLLVSAVLMCSAPASSDLLGLWETEQVSRGGIGHTIEFKPDGSYVEAISVIVDFYYRIENGRLVVSEKEVPSNTDIKNAPEIVFDGDTLILKGKDPDSTTMRKERLGKKTSDKPSVIGAWCYRHYTGAIAYERFTPDGRVNFRLPMSSSTGCYSIDGKQFTLIKSNNEKGSMPFKVQGDHLELVNKNKPAARYQHEQDEAWYPRNKIDYQKPKDLQKQ
jgi:hypothetical protein